ncbi:MAG TPA: DUF4279 domain-containing protein [Stellaceae bacterium]|nr:DUF4279 domain-containing protein [Stellaceae bacterium]
MNRVSATFSIWSKQLTPNQISEILQFQPDRTVLRGIDRTPPRPRPEAFGWHVTCSQINVDLPATVISNLLERVSPIYAKIRNLRKRDGEIELNFYLHVAPKSTEIPLWIDKKILHQIGKLEGNLDIEFFDL